MQVAEILIVEDDPQAGEYLKELLMDIGYKIHPSVPTGEEAIEFVKKHPVDIVLMDIELNGKLDGVETVQAIQKNKKIQQPYFIYITSLQDEITFKRAKATFPKYFLSKPFNKFQLLDIIDSVMESPN